MHERFKIEKNAKNKEKEMTTDFKIEKGQSERVWMENK